MFAACPRLDPRHGSVQHALQLLAIRIQQLSKEIAALKQWITKIVQGLSPALLKVYGVGPDSAASLLIAAGGNHDRLTGEASFAALCSVSPVEHSSGKVGTAA
ncbi:transposase [Streptomyces formicae]|uniref:Mobile element protein n=1 Tax=Streptomyces formicae TaxID=1616117 RepID=A0A291Q1J6_9ACTN|nr:transposase [Streptomyces formicae]ATL25611.1 Mobile element protein [Streptomyces formicae]